MLTTQPRSQFVTKILTSADGKQYKVVFLVSLVNGEVKAQMISAEPVVRAAPICLPISLQKTPSTFTYTPSFSPKISLFNSLFFFDSQPTRAPSGK